MNKSTHMIVQDFLFLYVSTEYLWGCQVNCEYIIPLSYQEVYVMWFSNKNDIVMSIISRDNSILLWALFPCTTAYCYEHCLQGQQHIVHPCLVLFTSLKIDIVFFLILISIKELTIVTHSERVYMSSFSPFGHFSGITHNEIHKKFNMISVYR